ncbi:zinc protease [Aureimonas sp. Leaf454]|nr:zinc protease [Aureimonas sp. Leaf454]
MLATTTFPRAALSTALRAGAVLSFTFGSALAFATASEAVEIQEVTSPGGIKALLVEDYTNPLIAVNFAFEGAGSTADAPGKEGTGALLTGMLDEGAGPIESAQFQSKLDELGVSLSFDVGLDNFTGSFRTIVENEDEAFDLLRLALNEPRFDPEPVARMKAQFVTNIVASLNDPGELAGKAWRQAVFPDHPYSRPTEGTAQTMGAITKEDLQSFRTKGFARGNLVVGVVGAIDAAALGQRLDTVFGTLAEKPDLPTVPDVSPAMGKTVNVPLDVPQTSIQFALPGVKRDDPDFFAAYLMNHVLGGGSFSSRLYQEIREKRGLAYGASSYLASYDHSAVLGAGTATRADKAQESVDIIRAEIKRMAETGPSPEELAKAKAYVTGAYAIQNLDSSLSIASTLVGIQLDRLGIDYIDKRKDLIEAVTMEDVKRMGQKLLSADPSVITVGPAAS